MHIDLYGAWLAVVDRRESPQQIGDGLSSLIPSGPRHPGSDVLHCPIEDLSKLSDGQNLLSDQDFQKAGHDRAGRDGKT